MSTDMLGQAYLCYLLQPSRKLMVARLNYSNEKDPETLVGPAMTISAVDASPLPVIMQIFFTKQNKRSSISGSGKFGHGKSLCLIFKDKSSTFILLLLN